MVNTVPVVKLTIWTFIKLFLSPAYSQYSVRHSPRCMFDWLSPWAVEDAGRLGEGRAQGMFCVWERVS